MWKTLAVSLAILFVLQQCFSLKKTHSYNHATQRKSTLSFKKIHFCTVCRVEFGEWTIRFFYIADLIFMTGYLAFALLCLCPFQCATERGELSKTFWKATKPQLSRQRHERRDQENIFLTLFIHKSDRSTNIAVLLQILYAAFSIAQSILSLADS